MDLRHGGEPPEDQDTKGRQKIHLLLTRDTRPRPSPPPELWTTTLGGFQHVLLEPYFITDLD